MTRGRMIQDDLLIAHLRSRRVLETCAGADEANCPMLVSKTQAVPI